MNRAAVGAVFVVMMSIAACGSDNGGTGDSGSVNGVDRAKLASNLSVDEQTALCNWYAPKVGGYGAADACAMVGISAPLDLADCLDGFPVCDVTVGDLADCYLKIIDAEKTCTTAANTAAISSAACAASASCFY